MRAPPKLGRPGEGPAEAGQVLRRGVKPARAGHAQAVLGQGALVSRLVDVRPAGLEIIAGEVSLIQTGLVKDAGVEAVLEIHVRHRLHHQLRQGEAVVAVDAVRAGVRLEALPGQAVQQIAGGGGRGVVEQHAAGKRGAHQPRGVVQQHADGDILIAGVRHLEAGQVPDHGLVQVQLPRLRQLHDGRGGEDLADGARAVNGAFALQRAGAAVLLRPLGAGGNDLSVLPHGPAGLGGLSIGHGAADGGPGGLVQVRFAALRRRGGEDEAQAQDQGQQQGAEGLGVLFHVRFPFPPRGKPGRSCGLPSQDTPSTRGNVKRQDAQSGIFVRNFPAGCGGREESAVDNPARCGYNKGVI